MKNDAAQDGLNTVRNELQSAQDARARGNEGMARVCARRAVGWAIKEHLAGKGVELDTPSAYEHIQYILNQEGTRQDTQRVLENMVRRVEKDTDWPVDIDLIAEAKWLIENLTGDVV